MPIDYDIDEDAGLVVTSVHGLVTAREYVEYPRRLLAEPRLPEPYRELFDTRRLERTTIRFKDIWYIVQAGRPTLPPPGSRIAVLVGSTASYGLGRAFQMLSGQSGIEVLVTWEEDDARRFLFIDLPPAANEPEAPPS